MPAITSALDAGFYIYTSFIFLLLCNAFMCKNHGRDVYIIWYIFWLFFAIFCALEFVTNGQVSTLCPGSSSDLCDAIYKSLIEPRGEVHLLLLGLAIVIGPQIATYILTAPFGCASAPLYVSQAMNIVRWSFVKFLAGAGAILLAKPSAKLLLHETMTLKDFVPGIVVLTSGFLYGLIFVILENMLDFTRKALLKPETRLLAERLVRIQQHFRRNRTRRNHTRVLEINLTIPQINQTLRTRTRLRVR